MNYDLASEHRIGMRDQDQDYAVHYTTGESLLLVVADGMAGYYGGQLAAEIAVGSITYGFSEQARPMLDDPAGFLFRAVPRAHEAIACYAAKHKLPEVPRTVVVACIVQRGVAWWIHVGDARFYLVRDGQLAARTRDHTPLQQLVDAGALSDESLASHPEFKRILMSLGAPVAPQPGPAASMRLEKNDILLLCSDGFWGPLRPFQLLGGLSIGALGPSINELANLAERRAGSHADNLTVLAVQWNEAPVAPHGALESR